MYFDLNDGNQDTLKLAPEKGFKWIDTTIARFPWKDYDIENNRLIEYIEHLFDVLPEQLDEDADDFDFWDLLTIGQKSFYSILVFEGELDNGGIFQFFWNKSEHAYSVLQVFELLELDQLAIDYEKALGRFEKIEEKLIALQGTVDMSKKSWEKDLAEVYEKAVDTYGWEEPIEEYFYEESFKSLYHQRMCDFIEQNKSLFVKV